MRQNATLPFMPPLGNVCVGRQERHWTPEVPRERTRVAFAVRLNLERENKMTTYNVFLKVTYRGAMQQVKASSVAEAIQKVKSELDFSIDCAELVDWEVTSVEEDVF
jgi:hypothetical protein